MKIVVVLVMTVIMSAFFMHGAIAVHAGTEVTKFEEPEVKRAYCGKQTPYAFCLCAFENQGCEVMNITQEEGKQMVDQGFREWVGTQIQAAAKQCIDGGSHWNTATRQCITCTEGDVRVDNKCVPPDQVVSQEVDLTQCAPVRQFNEDWRSFTDFARTVPVTEMNAPAQAYYTSLDVFATSLTDRQMIRHDRTLLMHYRELLLAYKESLVGSDAAAVRAAYGDLQWDTLLLQRIVNPFQNILQTVVEVADFDASLQSVVPEKVANIELPYIKVQDKIKERAWGGAFPVIAKISDGVEAARTAVNSLSQAPALADIDFSTDAVSALTEAHLTSTKIDRVAAEVAAAIAQSRFVEQQLMVKAAREYDNLEQARSDEFTRVYANKVAECTN